jgi:hypothetical protein
MNRSKNLAITALTTLAALSGCFEEPRTAPTLPTKPEVDCEKIEKRIQYLREFIDGSRTILETKKNQNHNITNDNGQCKLTPIYNHKKNNKLTKYTIVCSDNNTYEITDDKYNYGVIITNKIIANKREVTPQNPIPVSLEETNNNNLTFQVHSPEYWETVNEYNDNCTTEDPTP